MGELPEHLKGKTFADRPQDTRKGGRPVGSKNRSTLVRELLEARLDENHTYAQAMTKAVMEKALSGDTQAWDKLFDSAFGKVVDKQDTNLNGNVGLNIQIVKFSENSTDTE